MTFRTLFRHTTLLDRLKVTGEANINMVNLMETNETPNNFVIDENTDGAINPKHDVCIYIMGLGCNSEQNDYMYVKSLAREISGMDENTNTPKTPENNVIILCPKTRTALSTIELIYTRGCKKRNRNLIKNSDNFNILNTTIGNLTPFMKTLKENITNILKKQKKYERKVLIYGHSFGGAVANKISEIISNDRLHIFATGPIYITTTEKLQKETKLINLFIRDSTNKDRRDVAWTKLASSCLNDKNKIPPNFVYFYDNKIIRPGKDHKSTPIISLGYIFGTKLEWEIHNSYSLLNLNDYLTKIVNNTLKETDPIYQINKPESESESEPKPEKTTNTKNTSIDDDNLSQTSEMSDFSFEGGKRCYKNKKQRKPNRRTNRKKIKRRKTRKKSLKKKTKIM